MKKLLILLLCIHFSNTTYAQLSEDLVANELILKFKTNKKPNTKKVLQWQKFENPLINTLNKKNNVNSIHLTGHKKQGDTFLLKFNIGQNIEQLIKTYLNTGLFEYVEPNYIGTGHGVETTPSDALYYNRQWGHYNDGTFALSTSTNDADIDTDLAWDITQGDPDLVVAVLDSGLRLTHPEFSGRIWSNNAETQNGLDSDGNGYVDDIDGGWDFANGDNDPTDDHGHGTNVTGIALATGNNAIGYAGVNWNSKIMTLKILDSNNIGLYTWWAEAIYYAVDNGASVINMSVGGNGSSSLLESAINYAFNNNVPVIVSTGNQDSVIQYPARYTNAFAVGSTNPDDTRTSPFFWSASSGSNFGPELDFVAPGNYIYGLSYSSNTNYNSYWGGTSQAAPHVTGVVSLILSIDPSLTVNEVRTILEESSEDQVGDSEDTSGWDQYFGHGRINAFQALTHPTLDINSFENTENAAIYPNPLVNGNSLTITNLNNRNYSINMYTLLGQSVFEMSASIDKSRQIRLTLPKLKQGTYFIRVTNTLNAASFIKKILIK